jgi:hypothetical protein
VPAAAIRMRSLAADWLSQLEGSSQNLTLPQVLIQHLKGQRDVSESECALINQCDTGKVF